MSCFSVRCSLSVFLSEFPFSCWNIRAETLKIHRKKEESRYTLSKLLKSADNLLNANNSSILQKLKNNKGQQDIVKVLIPMYNDDEFRDKLDIDPNLLGFNNGVLDLRDENLDNSRCIFDFFSIPRPKSW